MPNVKREHRIAKIHMAAGLFVGFTRDAKIIAEKLDTSERNVQRWAKTPEWKTALEAIGYQGDRSFRVNRQGRDPERDNPDLFQQAKVLYLQNAETAPSSWKCAGITAEKLRGQDGWNIQPRTIWNWARRYGWRYTEKS